MGLNEKAFEISANKVTGSVLRCKNTKSHTQQHVKSHMLFFLY